MFAADPGDIPGWQRLLARPRLLHRLATLGLWLAALIAATTAYIRAAPEGVSQETRLLSYVFDAFVWTIVLLAACGEAFVAGTGARERPDGRPHFQIVFTLGLVMTIVLVLASISLAGADPARLGQIGRIVRALLAGLLPLLAGVTLTAGLAFLWIHRLRPLIEARLEARLRAYEEERHEAR